MKRYLSHRNAIEFKGGFHPMLAIKYPFKEPRKNENGLLWKLCSTDFLIWIRADHARWVRGQHPNISISIFANHLKRKWLTDAKKWKEKEQQTIMRPQTDYWFMKNVDMTSKVFWRKELFQRELLFRQKALLIPIMFMLH